MVLSDSRCQDFPDTGRSIGVYIVFYQGGPIDDCINIPVTFSQSSSESEYNAACTAGMALANLRMINN